jgi:hypothetical protein
MLKNHKKSIYSPPESNSFGWQILGTLASNRQISRHASTNNKEGGNNMNLNWFKHHTCPEDEEEATLLVDPETETIPETDEDGNLLYYCIEGQHIFSVDEDGSTGNSASKKRR